MTKLTPQQMDKVNELINAALKPILVRLTNLESAKIGLESANKSLDAENKRLQSEIVKLSTTIETNTEAGISNEKISQARPLFTSLFQTEFNDEKQTNKPVLNNDEINLINAISIDNNQKLVKEKNLLVFGLDKHETKDDKALIEDLFKVMNTDSSKIKKIFRFKSQENKKPIVRIEFFNKADKFSILKNAKKLNESKYKGVFINQDLTESQRALFKIRKQQRDNYNSKLTNDEPYYYAIRNFEVLRIYKKVNNSNASSDPNTNLNSSTTPNINNK